MGLDGVKQGAYITESALVYMYKSFTVKIDDLIIELVESKKKKHAIYPHILYGSITCNTSANEYRVRGHFRYFQGHKGDTV